MTRFAQIAVQAGLGVLFVYSGLVKTLDGQSLAYAVVTNYGMPTALMFLSAMIPPIEVGLGLALMLNVRTVSVARWVCACLVLFSAAIVYGLLRGDMDSCGCFGGAMDVEPGMALVRNGVLFGLALWLSRVRRPADSFVRPGRARCIVAAVVLSALLTGYSSLRPFVSSSTVKVGQPFPVAGLAADVPDLERGSWAIFAFHGKCGHCWDATPQVETLTGRSELQVIGLTDSSPEELAEYRQLVAPEFPIYHVETADFRRMVKRLPDLWFVQDGIVVHKTLAGANAWPIVAKYILPKMGK